MRSLFGKFFKENLYTYIIHTLFYLYIFVYIWLKIDPVLYYERQEPVFFLTSGFFNGFLAYPGGLAEYISLLLAQSFYFSWFGALVITLIICSVSLLTRAAIKSISNSKNVQIVHLVPAILLAAIHSQYQHPLSLDLGLLISLGSYYLFSRFSTGKPLYRIIFFVIISGALYFSAGGFLLLFTLLCIIHELAKYRNYYPALCFLLVSALIPYLSLHYLFIITTRDAFAYLLFPLVDYIPEYAVYILYLFYPVLMILSLLYNKFVAEKNREKVLKILLMKNNLRYVVQLVVLIAGMILLFNKSFREGDNIQLQIDYNARFGKWEKVLQLITPQTISTKIVLCQLNRALYHTGQLSSRMFAYPQRGGSEGLVFNEDISTLAPLLRSDIFFELGHINEAEHWAFEAFSVTGYSGWNLQRLVLTSILKGNIPLAQKCLNMLDKTILFKSWSEHYRQYIYNRNMIRNDVQLSNLSKCMSKNDFVVLPDNFGNDLESILKSGVNNKMAFEYLMADYLLTRQYKKVVENLDKLPELGYKDIPRNYEEALLAYASLPGNKDFDLHKYHINPNTLHDFQDLEKIMKSFKRKKMEACNSIMAKYGDTYWAYLLYN